MKAFKPSNPEYLTLRDDVDFSLINNDEHCWFVSEGKIIKPIFDKPYLQVGTN